MVINNICHKWGNKYYWYIKWQETPIELKNILYKGFHDRALHSKAHTRTNLWLVYKKWERMPYLWEIDKDCEYHWREDLTSGENHKTYEEFMSGFLATFAKWLQPA